MAEPFPDLIEESFEEAAFLWRRWEAELTSLTRNLQEVYSWTEERLHGALDGVRVGGASAVELAANELRSDDVERVAVATAILASIDAPEGSDAIVAALKTADGARLGAMLRGLELLGSDQALRATAPVLTAPGAVQAGALCRLKLFRRILPGTELAAAFESGVPDVQVAALRTAWLAPPESAGQWISAALTSDNGDVRYSAVESGLCLRVARTWETAMQLASQDNAAASPYLKLLGIFGTADEHEPIYAALRVPQLQQAAVRALGHIGSVRAVDACVSGMQDGALARACGEAYSWITGADLERDNLAAEETAADAPAFEDDDLEADLVPPPEALWPLPGATAVKRHWLAIRSGWPENVRHIRGLPVSRDTLLSTMETAPMIRRADIALELRVKTRGRYDVETRAFAARQRQMMTVSRAAVSSQRT